jgi:hypothetical protein
VSLLNVIATGSSPPTHHYSPIVTDTGCTGHFFTQNSHLLNICPINQACPSIAVMLPDGAVIHSTHVGELNLPFTPFEARLVHIFPKLAAGSLLSAGQLCDSGCTATFTHDEVHIDYQGKTIIRGTHSPSPSSGTRLTFSHPLTRIRSPMLQNSRPRLPSSLPWPTQYSAHQSSPPFARP